jgi:hypothetical protein
MAWRSAIAGELIPIALRIFSFQWVGVRPFASHLVRDRYPGCRARRNDIAWVCRYGSKDGPLERGRPRLRGRLVNA